MGKIMAKLKHNYNAFPELQTKFFHKHCVIFTKFQQILSQIAHSKNFRYNS